MSKTKAFTIYAACYLAILVMVGLVMNQFFFFFSYWFTFTPIILAAVFSLHPHKVESKTGSYYGLKSLFSKKIFPMK